VTKEEIEEGRRLHSAFTDELKRFARGENAFEIVQRGDAWEAWFNTHASELLALAEEARWRVWIDEKPEREVPFMATFTSSPVASVYIVELDETGQLRHDHGSRCRDEPAYWRPLPSPPEETCF
jgi:hypothetical protein